MHWISKKSFQRAALKSILLFESAKDGSELLFLLAFGQHLKAKVMIPHVLLIDDQHRQKHIKQVSYSRWRQLTQLDRRKTRKRKNGQEEERFANGHGGHDR